MTAESGPAGVSAERVAAVLPLDERVYHTLMDALGQDEADAEAAHDVAMHFIAEALKEAASEAEWKFRSMSFRCGLGESTTRLHPVGAWLRERAAALVTEPSREVGS